MPVTKAPASVALSPAGRSTTAKAVCLASQYAVKSERTPVIFVAAEFSPPDAYRYAASELFITIGLVIVSNVDSAAEKLAREGDAPAAPEPRKNVPTAGCLSLPVVAFAIAATVT